MQLETEIIDYYSLDADGCLFNDEYHRNGKKVIEANQALIGFIQSKTKAGHKLKFMVGSNRQDLYRDWHNLTNNRTDSAFIATETFVEKIKQELSTADIEIDKYLLGDTFSDASPGTVFDQAISNINAGKNFLDGHKIDTNLDEEKILLLYAQMNRASLESPNAIINFNFFDDRPKILSALYNFYQQNSGLIPKNVRLNLYQYTGQNPKIHEASIQGIAENADPKYQDTIKNMVQKKAQRWDMLDFNLTQDDANLFYEAKGEKTRQKSEIQPKPSLPQTTNNFFVSTQKQAKKTRYISLDADGCLFNEEYFNNGKDVVAANQKLIDAIVSSHIAGTKLRFIIGSNRQDLCTDMANACKFNVENCTESIFLAIQKIAEEVKKRLPGEDIEIDKFLMQDIFTHKDPGTNFDIAINDLSKLENNNIQLLKNNGITEKTDTILDEYKLTLLYAQMQRAALAYPDEKIEFEFYDDRDDILDNLFTLYSNTKDFKNSLTLTLKRYDGKEAPKNHREFDSNQGTKPDADNDYYTTVKNIAEKNKTENMNRYKLNATSAVSKNVLAAATITPTIASLTAVCNELEKVTSNIKKTSGNSNLTSTLIVSTVSESRFDPKKYTSELKNFINEVSSNTDASLIVLGFMYQQRRELSYHAYHEKSSLCKSDKKLAEQLFNAYTQNLKSYDVIKEEALQKYHGYNKQKVKLQEENYLTKLKRFF